MLPALQVGHEGLGIGEALQHRVEVARVAEISQACPLRCTHTHTPEGTSVSVNSLHLASSYVSGASMKNLKFPRQNQMVVMRASQNSKESRVDSKVL